MPAVRLVRVFLSSPGDVAEERRLAHEFLKRLDSTPLLRGQVAIEVVSWDDPDAPVPMNASLPPQDAVNLGRPKPSECDITICILWGRMGTPLSTPRKPDGTQYLSGTEWEFEDARQAGRTILLYRRTTTVTAAVTDPAFLEKQRQALLVEKFFGRFQNADGSLRAGYTPYDQPAELEGRLRKDLEGVLSGFLSTVPDEPAVAPLDPGLGGSLVVASPSTSNVAPVPTPESVGVEVSTPDTAHSRWRPEWRAALAFAIGASLSAVAWFLGQRIGAGAGLVLTTLACVLWVRSARRSVANRARSVRVPTRQWTRRGDDTGFRGLLSYGPGDVLPGDGRRAQALGIVRDVLHPGFRFGVVAGGVGSGKTSLLASGLMPLATERGMVVLFVRSPRNLSQELRATLPPGEMVTLGHTLDELSRRCERLSAKGPLLLIVDQFEELLLDHPDGDDRQRLGAFLARPTQSASTKVLCGVREDYLVHFRSLAPALANPISTSTLFHIKNFSVADAAEVIRECAERERQPIQPELAHTIAADLAQSGLVRPPELQIVCTALIDRLTEAGYEQAGGARGVLTHYIQRTLDLCPDPRVARSLVRALVDFETIPASKRKPQTVGEILERVGIAENPKSVGLATETLEQLERERVVAVDGGSSDRRYRLVHDYLIDAVSGTTADRATRVERADQLLRIYLRSTEADPRATIPMARLRFVTRYASPVLRQSTAVLKLIRDTKRRLVRIAAAVLAALVVIPALGLLAFSATIWQPELLARHSTSSAAVNLTAAPFVVSQNANRVRVWDPRDAALRASVDVDQMPFSVSFYVGVKRPGKTTLNFIDVRTGREFETPFPASTQGPWPRFSLIGEYLVSVDGGGDTTVKVTVWDIRGQRATTAYVTPCSSKTPEGGPYFLFNLHALPSGDGVLLRCAEGLLLSRGATAASPYFARNIGPHDVLNIWGKYAALISYGAPSNNLSVLRLEDGEIVGSRTVPASAQTATYFSLDGKRMFHWQIAFGSPLSPRASVIPLPGFVPPTGEPAEVQAIFGPWPSPVFIFSAANESTVIGGTAVTVAEVAARDLSPESIAGVAFHQLNTSMLVIRQTAEQSTVAELWKPAAEGGRHFLGSTLRDVNAFTVDGQAIVTFQDTSTMVVYDAADGTRLATLKEATGPVVSYDRPCQRLHVWTSDGRVMRYTQGLRIPFIGFLPSQRCD